MRSLKFLSLILMSGALLPLGAEEKPDTPPTPIRTPSPESDGKTAGVVIAILDLDDKGSVIKVTIKRSTNPKLDEPSIEALKKWKFTPGKLAGKAIPCSVTIPLKFDGS